MQPFSLSATREHVFPSTSSSGAGGSGPGSGLAEGLGPAFRAAGTGGGFLGEALLCREPAWEHCSQY